MTRRSFDVPGLGHGTNPTPVVTRVGGLVTTAAVQGWDRATQELPADLQDEVALVFANLADALGAAGASLDDVAHVDVLAASGEVRGPLNTVWRERFPDAASRPTRHLQVTDLPAGFRVQLKAKAFVERTTGD